MNDRHKARGIKSKTRRRQNEGRIHDSTAGLAAKSGHDFGEPLANRGSVSRLLDLIDRLLLQ